MALITRITRLFQADLHAVLDRVEEPGPLLRQAVREMEESLAGEERRLKLMSHEQEQLAAREGALNGSLEEIEAQLDVCFASGKEDLARALIRRKLEAQRACTLLGRRRETLGQTLSGLQAQVQEHRAELAGMRQKAEVFADNETPAADHPWNAVDVAVHDEDVEVAFLREQQRRATS